MIIVLSLIVYLPPSSSVCRHDTLFVVWDVFATFWGIMDKTFQIFCTSICKGSITKYGILKFLKFIGIFFIMGRMGICFTSVATSWWGEACCLLLCFLTGTSYCVARCAVLNFDYLGSVHILIRFLEKEVCIQKITYHSCRSVPRLSCLVSTLQMRIWASEAGPRLNIRKDVLS